MKQILETNNYGRFELHDFNRNIGRIKYLEESMRKHGWIDAYPMHVVRNGNGKLKIKAGHHRFHVARTLGIPVKYVESADNASIHELEKATSPWVMSDYLYSFCRMGKPAYLKVKEYHEATGIGLNSCISMLGGNSAGTHNFDESFKSGSFQIKDTAHAGIVADIIMHCKKCGIKWATHDLFVRAVSRIAWAEGFDPSILKHKIGTFPYLIEKQANLVAYTEMIDSVYNRQSKVRVPLAFNADKAARERTAAGINAMWLKRGN